jgi:hypothetical protein
MSPNLRLRARHCLTFLGLAAAAWQPSAAQELVEATGPYLHRSAPATFPMRVGGFGRSQILRYDKEGRDVSASYEFATPEGQLVLTVYVYPAAAVPRGERRKACEREFESATDAIRMHDASAAMVEDDRAVEAPGSRKGLRHRAVFRLNMRFAGTVQPVRSEAHLYCYVGGDWFVKYRVSAPVAVAAPDAVEAFIRNGPWPGRGSSESIARLGLGRRQGTPLSAQR